MKPERRLHDDAQCAERARQELRDVVAGNRLDDLGTAPRHRPIRLDEAGSEQEIAPGAVAEAPRPAGIGREHSAHAARGAAVRVQREHLTVLMPVLASAGSPNLPEPVDLVLVVDTYHHIDDRVAYFAALRASLRSGGRLAIVDFKPDSPNGPPPKHRITAEQVTTELNAAGYSLLATHLFLPRQYFLVFLANAS